MDINKFPLFDPNKFHDSCGIGFITTESAKPEKRVLSTNLSSLKKLSHRGAKSYDSKTGDGVGILTDLPKNFFKNFLLYNYIDGM